MFLGHVKVLRALYKYTAQYVSVVTQIIMNCQWQSLFFANYFHVA